MLSVEAQKMLDTCPYCHRRLVSHASLRCNWCGEEIKDPEYQANAKVEREIFQVDQAMHDAASRRFNYGNYGSGFYPGNQNIVSNQWPTVDLHARRTLEAEIRNAALKKATAQPDPTVADQLEDPSAPPRFVPIGQQEPDQDEPVKPDDGKERFKRLEL